MTGGRDDRRHPRPGASADHRAARALRRRARRSVGEPLRSRQPDDRRARPPRPRLRGRRDPRRRRLPGRRREHDRRLHASILRRSSAPAASRPSRSTRCSAERSPARAARAAPPGCCPPTTRRQHESCSQRAESDAERLVRRASGRGDDRVATSDPVGYARHLYEWLRDADDRGVSVIVAVLPATGGPRSCDPRPPRQGVGRPSRLSSSTQTSRTSSAGGCAHPSIPPTVMLTVLLPASGTSSSRHQHRPGTVSRHSRT